MNQPVPAAASRRIVIYARALRAGSGSSRILLALTRGLHTAGHHVEVVADRIDAGLVQDAGGRPCYPLGFALAQGLARRLLSRDLQLRLRQRAVNGRRADLVIGDGELRRQHVLLVHNIMRREVEEIGAAATADHERNATRQDQALRESAFELAIANSELTRQELLRRFGFEPARVAVVQPGFDPAEFSRTDRAALREPARRTLGLAPNERAVAFISSGHFVLRGVDVLAATFARLDARARVGLRLLCAGSERNIDLLRAAFKREGVDPALVNASRKGSVRNLYHAADLLFHPAHFETFGLVVIEAAACGCPVLTSASVGAAGLFADTTAATAVTARPDARLFAPLLNRLLTDDAYRAAVADSQHAAVRGHTWSAYGDAVIRCLGERQLL